MGLVIFHWNKSMRDYSVQHDPRMTLDLSLELNCALAVKNELAKLMMKQIEGLFKKPLSLS